MPASLISFSATSANDTPARSLPYPDHAHHHCRLVAGSGNAPVEDDGRPARLELPAQVFNECRPFSHRHEHEGEEEGTLSG